jgi:hypothetical protein
LTLRKQTPHLLLGQAETLEPSALSEVSRGRPRARAFLLLLTWSSISFALRAACASAAQHRAPGAAREAGGGSAGAREEADVEGGEEELGGGAGSAIGGCSTSTRRIDSTAIAAEYRPLRLQAEECANAASAPGARAQPHAAQDAGQAAAPHAQ